MEKKTIEEILDDNDAGYESILIPNAISAMQEYAAQETAGMIARERVIKIIGHILSDIDDCMVRAGDVVIEDYLPTT